MSDLKTNEILLARLAEGLDSTAKMTQALLSDLRESEADFAAMKTELNILKENVKSLSELIRDGGTSAIMTRVALIEQSLNNIKDWMDNHVDIHHRFKDEISQIKEQMNRIESRLASVENTIKEIEYAEKEREKAKRASIDREMDFVHEQKKNDDKIRAEKHSAFLKIVTAVLVGIFGLVSGYLANSCTEAAGKAAPATSIPQAPVSSPAPAPVQAYPASPAPSQTR